MTEVVDNYAYISLPWCKALFRKCAR